MMEVGYDSAELETVNLHIHFDSCCALNTLFRICQCQSFH